MLRNARATKSLGPRRDVRRWEAARGIGRSRPSVFSLYVRTVSWQTPRASIAIARFAARAYIKLSVWQHLATTWNHNPEGICGATTSRAILRTQPRLSRRRINHRSLRPTLTPVLLRQRRSRSVPALQPRATWRPWDRD